MSRLRHICISHVNSERSKKVRKGSVAKDVISYWSKLERLGTPIFGMWLYINDHRIFTHQQLWHRWQIHLGLIVHELVCFSHFRVWIWAFSIHSSVTSSFHSGGV